MVAPCPTRVRGLATFGLRSACAALQHSICAPPIGLRYTVAA